MSRAVKAVVVVWVVSILFSLPWIFYNKVGRLVVLFNVDMH